MNIYRNTLIGILLIFMIFAKLSVIAQDNKKANAKVIVSVEITNTEGNSIEDATIISANLRDAFKSDENGSLSLQTSSSDVLVIKADGYEATTIKVSDLLLKNGAIVLTKLPAFTGDNHILNTQFSSMDERRSTGAYSIVKGEELENNPTMSIENSLGGRLNGLFQFQTTGAPSELNHSMYVRGSTLGNLITIVDGIERDLSFLDPEVIESVALLKDASLKAMYGGIQTSGILVVTTKRGKANENKVRINVQKGVSMPTRLPKYLNSYDYARFYNQALDNDGLGQLRYSDNDLDAYKNGNSPYLYPDVDYYDAFLNKSMDITKVSAQMTGGNENIRYFGHLGYQNEGGLEKFTSYPNHSDVLTMRTSVDGEITHFLTFSAGFNGALKTIETPNMPSGTFMSALSTLRPNEFPILIPGNMVGEPAKAYVFGGTSKSVNNPYGLLTAKGYNETKNIYIQSDFALNINLDQWIKGLSLKPSISFDIYNDALLSKAGTFAIYTPSSVISSTGSDSLIFTQIGQDTKSTAQSFSDANVERSYTYNLTANFNRTFGVHDIQALMNYYQFEKEVRNVNDNPRRQNFGLHLNYMISKKYIADITINRVGVNSFSPENRVGYFPALGLGWILSKDNPKSAKALINYFKIRASYGILGSTTFNSEGGFSTRLFQDVWNQSGTIGLNDGNYKVNMTRAGNPDLGFQKSRELNFGFEAQMLNKSLWFTMGYFNNELVDQISLPTYVPGISGLNEALSFVNNNKTGLKGVEAEFSYNNHIGDLVIDFGGNFTYGVTNRIKFMAPDYPAGAEGLIFEGRPYDVILGLVTEGVFASQDDIDGSPLQYFGSVKPGDLKYVDSNNDGVVDDRDRVEIGNSNPRLQYGINLNLNYKAFNLDVLGTGYGQYNGLISNSPYYGMSGSDKYSQIIVNGLPNDNEHPQLSYQSNTNNFVSSDYWIVNRGYFKLRSVEFGYTLPKSLTKKAGINNWKFFARGFNLLTISKIKDLDPESLSAGVTNYPLFSTFTGGVSVSF